MNSFGFLLGFKLRKSMNANPPLFRLIYFIFLLDTSLIVITSAENSPYRVFLNCNSSESSAPPAKGPPPPAEVHTWSPEKLFKSRFSTVFPYSNQDPHNPKSPQIFVAVFHSEYTFTSIVCPGTKFIRLHFYPASFSGFEISKALFSVSINGRYTLLSTSETSFLDSLNTGYIIKEFYVNIDGQTLNITFTPSLNISGAYGFVNKIQIVSMPSILYIRENTPVRLINIGHSSNFYIEKSIALEAVYRVNVGGQSIAAEHDSAGMLRDWSEDKAYSVSDHDNTDTLESTVKIKYSSEVSAYTAPEEVYATARIIIPKGHPIQRGSNMTWLFPIESEFCYLVRFHFCEISTKITKQKQRVFDVYVNNQTAENGADVIRWSGGAYIPVYRDYLVNLSGQGLDYLWIGLQGNSESTIPDSQAILNGLEILKLSDASNNLAGSKPYKARMISHTHHQNKLIYVAPEVFLGFFVALWFVSLLYNHLLTGCFSRFGWQKKTFMLWQSDHFRHFSLPEIMSATNNFMDSLLIGAGGFGKVYKGSIDGGTTTVAIKRANPCSNQGLNEFKTEISMLSDLQHSHLVSLIGYCMENKEMILVYDYLARGTLRDHLYNNNKPPLEWKRRLKICIGAARGLHYLHTGAKHTIIHRDVKSTNILLDKNWVCKVSDFGLSKLGPNMLTQSNTHVSTVVKGTFGYLDPEYYRRRKLTEKSDVYSFGVVLFEVLCARPAVLAMADNEEEEHEKVNLAEWAVCCYQSGTLDTIVDPYLQGKVNPGCFKTFTDIAKKCLADRGCDRPNMSDVLWNLEMAWQQQDAADKEGMVCDAANNRTTSYTKPINSDPTPGIEFSEIMVPIGR